MVTRLERWRALAVLVCGGLGTFGFGLAAQPVQGTLSREGVELFERRIRPVLVRQCYSCHSAAAQKLEGDLGLDRPEDLLRARPSGPLIIPGDPAKSRLIEVMRRGHPDSGTRQKTPVSRATVADFEAWIRLGAPDPRAAGSTTQRPIETSGKHWSFQPIRNPSAPAAANNGWVRDPIDAFVAAGFAREGKPLPAAVDPVGLIRRLSFDLVGLPPTSAEIEAYLSDPPGTRVEKLVDRLLDSPHFGERWGAAWLQTIGYADVAMADLSPVRENAWRYRDYVIAAFNHDKPYDDFVREQLAGDLLAAPHETAPSDQLIATGFLMVGARLPAEPRRARLNWEITDEQIDVTTRTFLGLSVTCARCHDHNADPITTHDYYALAGIFNSTTTLTSPVEEGRRNPTRWLERSLATQEQMAELSEYETRLEELKQQFNEAREMKRAFPGEVDSTALSGIIVDNLAAQVHGAWKESSYSTNFVDRNYLHDGNADKGKKSARFVPDLPSAGKYDVLVSYTPRDNRATNVPVTIHFKGGAKTVLLNQTLPPTVDKVFASVGRFDFDAGSEGSVLIANDGTRGFVVADAVRFVPVNQDQPESNVAAAEEESPEKALLNFREIERELLDFRSKKPVLPSAMAVQEGKVQDARLRLGGDPDKQGAKVPRGFLSAVGTPDSTLYAITDESSGRLELAHWIVNPDNPLTARIAVNRIWAQLTGDHLVSTDDDFGALGARPTNPDLLDHLAWRFMSQGWSVKKLVRAIVLSSAYQSAGWRRTLPPEVLRDASLALAHELDLAAGGPWMPTNNLALDGFGAARRVQTSSTRRTVYLPVVRDRVADCIAAFQSTAPAALASTNPPGKRPALSAAQRFFAQRAQAWADRLIELVPTDETKRVTVAYRDAFGRPPQPQEVTAALQQLAAAKVASKEAVDPAAAAWAAFCASLLSSEEFRSL